MDGNLIGVWYKKYEKDLLEAANNLSLEIRIEQGEWYDFGSGLQTNEILNKAIPKVTVFSNTFFHNNEENEATVEYKDFLKEFYRISTYIQDYSNYIEELDSGDPDDMLSEIVWKNGDSMLLQKDYKYGSYCFDKGTRVTFLENKIVNVGGFSLNGSMSEDKDKAGFQVKYYFTPTVAVEFWLPKTHVNCMERK